MCRLLFGYRHEHSGNRVMEWAVLTPAVAAYAQHKSSLHLQKTEVQAAFLADVVYPYSHAVNKSGDTMCRYAVCGKAACTWTQAVCSMPSRK